MVDKKQLVTQVKEYCENRYPPKTPSDPDFPYNGHGNTKEVLAIVSLVVNWLEKKPKAREAIAYRPQETNLADVTGMAVHELTRFDFPWAEVCGIIDSAGKTAFWTGRLDRLVARHPRATERFLGMRLSVPSDSGKNVKKVVQDLAKSILWAQSLAFLVEHDYEMPTE